MPPISRIAALTGLVVLLPACARIDHPVVARDPVPPPPPGYQVVCDPGIVLLNAITRNCQVVDPAVVRRTTVVRAKG